MKTCKPPLRKITGREGNYVLLECGHRLFAWTGAKKARRCTSCLNEMILGPPPIASDRKDAEDYKERRHI